MCGIYGMVSRTGAPLQFPELLPEMAALLSHRGPDGHGEVRWGDAAVGTDRLRIVDLNARADQPFVSPDEAVALTCNGEIYNALDLRSRYLSFPYQSKSDVEAILPLYLEKGARGLPDLDGMFALAIWDSRNRTLTLARDRAGEKPLFYLERDGETWFASEIQALLIHPRLRREIDRTAFEQYLTLGYVLEPRTLFDSIRRVEAGSILVFHRTGERLLRYWDPTLFTPVPMTPASARSRLADELERAIRHQLTADVPIGVFLSGGVDSSLLAFHASRGLGPERVEAFTMAFSDGSYDESVAAAQVARGLGVRHTVIPWNHLTETLDTIVSRISEPIADPAILPTYSLAKAARERVKVILSGEGADELFGGYPTYVGHRLMPWFRRLPSPLRSCISAAVNRLPASAGKTPFEYLAKRFIASSSQDWLDRHVTWFGTGLPKLIRQSVWTTESLRDEIPLGSDEMASAMLLDYRTYLRDNLLAKVDRATMLASVEARAPFLDRDLTSLAFSLPSRMRVHGLTTKWILKRAAAEWLSPDVVYRRKRGFSVPVARWLNVELRSEVDRVLDRRRIDEEGLIDGRTVERLVREHRDGVVNHGRGLWALLVLRRWLEHWMYDRPHELRRVDSVTAST